MNITSLQLEPLSIPFRLGFKHASAERTVTSAVLARCEMGSGAVGLGEGCPRPYVTGESVETCHTFFAYHRESITKSIHGLDDLVAWMEAHAEAIDANPAAWCALELALLEAMAKEREVALEELMGLPSLSGTFTYTAILGDSDLKTYTALVERYVNTGFREFKLKISGDAAKDREKLAVLRASAPGAHVRLDANNLWANPDDFATYYSDLGVSVGAVEEPLKAADYAGLREVIHATGLRIILDESFLAAKHFGEAASLDGRAIINMRVSKMGGLLRSLAIVREAAARGIPVIVGAQVGETSILTRAALTVVNGYRTNVMAQEGAFGTWLLEEDIVSLPVMFGAGGRLEAGSLPGANLPGFGLNYVAERLPF